MRPLRQTFLTAILATLLLSLAPAPALGWHDTGHMLVSQIAYLNLTPEAKARVDKLLVTAPGRRPYIHLCAGYYTPETCEKTYDPVTIGVWMDDFRGDSLNDHYGPWHYINHNPFFDGVPARPEVGPEPENVLARINWAANTLRAGTGREKTDAEVLGFLYHLVGDVHQPLHATTRYTAERPDGDAGGNGFRIKPPEGTTLTNLHAFWDAAAGAFGHESPRRPLDEATRARLRSLADELMKQYPAGKLPEAANYHPHAWVAESNTLARRQVYTGIREGEVPSAEYTAAARNLSRQRIALAGYRLAGLLNSLFVKAGAPR
ncbi:MAG TPA: S1/P1 nuclease [Pyrinomonadaceae bacterium]|nr:S1/P1 nuclease [Pyrinomonadaceae bacterium]